MSDHLTSADVLGLARGTLSPSGRRRLVAHMVHGCARCSRLLAPVLALPPAVEGKLDRARSSRATVVVEESWSSTATSSAIPEEPIRAYDLPVSRACAEALRCHRTWEHERRAPFEETIDRAPDSAASSLRAGVVPAESSGSPAPSSTHDAATVRARIIDACSLRGLLRVEMLLAASWDLRDSDPEEMVRIAELALFAAERLDPAHYERPVIADVRARVWAELANSYRVAGDRAGAEQAMTTAVAWRQRGSGDPWLVARVADLMASLFADQGRYSEARDLLGKVHQFYRRVGDHHLAGRALISRGMFASHDNDPRQALILLCDGLDLIDLRQDSDLAVHAVHAVLWNLVLSGRYRQARILLWRSRPLLLAQRSPLFLLRVRWLEGRTYAGLGDVERAEREFRATRQGFESAGSPYNAALVSLDLAILWLQQGKTQKVRQLVDETIVAFRALRIAREAVAALLVLREACDHDSATVDRVRAAIALLTELEHQPQPHRHLATATDPALPGS